MTPRPNAKPRTNRRYKPRTPPDLSLLRHVSPWQYTNPRTWLKRWYEVNHRKQHGFSHRFIARLLGLKSSASFTFLLRGSIYLSEKRVRELVRLADFDRREAQYFRDLVAIHQSRLPEYLMKPLIDLRRKELKPRRKRTTKPR